MIQLYDLNKTKIQGLKAYKDLNIESILSTGDKTLSFLFPRKLSKNIKEEGYIRTKWDEFVIKEISYSGEWNSIKATLNVEALEGQAWEHFDTTEKTITECLTLACTYTDWTVGTCNVTKRRTIRKTNCSTWDIIQQAKKTYLVEIEFDTINKKINIGKKIGSDKGVYFMDSLNLRNLDIQSNSYDFYTKLIAIGKDDLKVTVENYQYSNKKKTLIWKDERYTNIDSLKEDATAKLEEISKPYKAYGADILDLAKISGKYKILNYGLGDTITLISKENGIKEKQRIVKVKEYLDDPIKNTCEIANTLLRFEDIQKEQQDTTDTVNNITTDNGTVDGSAINSIKTDQISDFEVSVGKITNLTATNIRVDNLYVKKADIDSLNAVSARIGTVEITMATITQLDAEVARINQAFIKTATIENLNATNGKITLLETKVGSIDTILSKEIFAELISAGKIVAGSSIIAEGAIGSAQISSLSATKLSAGIIDATVITVKNLNADNITVGSINGKRIAEGAIDNSKVAEGANISGNKLNINDVIVNINGSTTQINGTKIQVGDRTLDLELSTQKIVLEENKTTISKQQATINAMDQAIKLKVDNQTFNTFKTTTDGNLSTINTSLNKNTASIDVLQKSILLKVSQTDIDNSINRIEVGGRNLLLNSRFAEQYRTDSVTNKHEPLYAAGYGGYNGGITNPTTSYHAHLDVTTFKIPVYEFNESDGTRNWKGVMQALYNIDNPGKYTISFDLYADGVGTKIFGGFYYTKKGETTQGFHSGQYSITDIKVNQWRNYSAVINLNADVDFTKSIVFYFYGYGFTSNSILYIKKPKLEKGNKATDWTFAPEDVDKAITTVNTNINTKVSEINLTLDGVTTRVGKTESASTVIDGKVTALSTRVATAEQKITPDGIVATVRNNAAYKGDLNSKASTTSMINAESSIKQLAESIKLKVSTTDIDKMINDKGTLFQNLITRHTCDWICPALVNNQGQYSSNLTSITFSGNAMVLTANGVGTDRYYELGNTNANDAHGFVNGVVYSISIEAYIPSGLTVLPMIWAFYHDGNKYGTVQCAYTNIAYNQFKRYDMTFTYPATAKGKFIRLVHQTAKQGESYRVRNITVVKGALNQSNKRDFSGTGDIVSAESEIGIMKGLISSKVELNGVRSSIEQNPTSVQVAFNNISPNVQNAGGVFTIRNGALQIISGSGRTAFKVDTDGYIYNEYGVGTVVQPGKTISVFGKTMADDKCSTLLRAFGLWHESVDSKYNMRIGSKSEIWFKDLKDSFQDIRAQWVMASQIRTTYNNDAGVILRDNQVDSGNGRLWLNYAGGSAGNISKTLIGDGMSAGAYGELHCGSLYTHGTKNRAVETEHFGIRALGAYEMPTPYFGDISRQVYEVIDGQCIVPIDPIFKETITDTGEYQVFLSKYGDGDIWTAEMYPTYFIVKGANIKFSWELKAIQRGYENNRLEQVQI